MQVLQGKSHFNRIHRQFHFQTLKHFFWKCLLATIEIWFLNNRRYAIVPIFKGNPFQPINQKNNWTNGIFVLCSVISFYGYVCFFLPKGQLISKGHFGIFNSPKKRTKNFYPSRLGQKFEFSSSFFGRIGDTKKTFRN